MAYPLPTPGDLRLRYPEFADVADDRVMYWIDDATRTVTERWTEADYPVGILSLAAHGLARSGALAGDAGGDMDGVTDFKSGTFSLSLSSDAVKRSLDGGYESTRYGQEFAELQRRNIGPGVRVVRGRGTPGPRW